MVSDTAGSAVSIYGWLAKFGCIRRRDKNSTAAIGQIGLFCGVNKIRRIKEA